MNSGNDYAKLSEAISANMVYVAKALDKITATADEVARAFLPLFAKFGETMNSPASQSELKK